MKMSESTWIFQYFTKPLLYDWKASFLKCFQRLRMCGYMGCCVSLAYQLSACPGAMYSHERGRRRTLVSKQLKASISPGTALMPPEINADTSAT